MTRVSDTAAFAEALGHAVTYLRISAISIPAMLVVLAATGVLRGLHAAHELRGRAEDLLEALWHQVREDPDFRPTGMGALEEEAWLEESRGLLRNYFKLEDPRSLQASELEWWIEYEHSDMQLRGVIDRLEERQDGSWILTDYKTGRVPGESRELSAFFGLRFYALVCWRAFGVIPKEIRLVYLADPVVLTLNPHERMLTAFENQMSALGTAVKRSIATGDWRTRPSPFCMSCSFQGQCPAWAEVQTTEQTGSEA